MVVVSIHEKDDISEQATLINVLQYTDNFRFSV